MDTNFSHLLLLYDEIYKCSLEVKELIEKGDLKELNFAIKQKGEKMEKALAFEKQLSLTPLEEEEKIQARGKIVLLEKENIEALVKKQQEVRKALNETSRESDLKSAYTFKTDQCGVSVDYTE